MAKQDDQDGASFASDEDDYEYDSDNENDDTQQQLCGMKRNASPSFALHPDNRGAPPRTTTTTSTNEDTCPKCQNEIHFPVADCETIAKWNKQTQDLTLVAIVLQSKHVLPAMKRRIRECAQHLHVSYPEAFVKLHQENWQLETVLQTHQEQNRYPRHASMRGAFMARACLDDIDFDLSDLEAIVEPSFEEQETLLFNETEEAAAVKPPVQDKSSNHNERKIPASSNEAHDDGKEPSVALLDQIDGSEEEEDMKPSAVDVVPVERVCQMCMEDQDIVVQSKRVLPAMKRRIRECAQHLHVSYPEAFVKLHQENWQLETVLQTHQEQNRYPRHASMRGAFMARAFLDDIDFDLSDLEAIVEPSFEEQETLLFNETEEAAAVKPPVQDESSNHNERKIPASSNEAHDDGKEPSVALLDQIDGSEEEEDMKPSAVDVVPVERVCQMCMEDQDIVVQSKRVLPAMKRRIRECAQHLHVSYPEAFVKLHQENWQLETVLQTHQEQNRYPRHASMRGAFMARAFLDDIDFDLSDLEAIVEPSFEEQETLRFNETEEAAAVKPPVQDESSNHNERKIPASSNEAHDDGKEPSVALLDQIDGSEEEEDMKPSAVDVVPVERVCQICLEDQDNLAEEDMMSMPCGHKFCKDCWKTFIELKFDNAIFQDECLQTTCPNAMCATVVTEVQIGQVAPNLLPEYEKRQLHSFVEGNRATMRWCPSPDCANRVAIRCQHRLFRGRINNAMVASCDGCQTKFCFRCGREPHDYRYCELDRPDSSAGKPVKNCPRCNIKIEKNGGCNHMTCKCGHHFCWTCLHDMNDSYHSCDREDFVAAGYAGAWRREAWTFAVHAVNIDYVLESLKEAFGSDDDEVARIFQQKKEMEHIAHYFNRYTAHEQRQHFAENQCTLLLEGRAIDFVRVSDLKSLSDTDFLAAANKRLVASRRMLKYTYCYAFYLPDEESEGMASHKGLFQNHQEQLEQWTEELSNIIEHATTYDDRDWIVNLVSREKSVRDACWLY